MGDWHGPRKIVDSNEKFHQWCNEILQSLVMTDELDPNKFRKL